ncbi:MAG TPA: SsrA-binding protein SmpB [Candidatus Tyrphobacter sp.]|nr:SsrA-binding protein SmpB [Candidatus Tyrphobacter sp.]
MEAAKNRRAFFDYEILEKHEAGLELLGFEVKAIKTGHINLAGAYVIIRGNEAELINADIPPYQPLNTPSGYDPKRGRRLLLSKEEIKRLSGKSQEKGLTLIPLRVYTKRGFVKLELALGRSRKKTDKRELIKKRDVEREIGRSLK